MHREPRIATTIQGALASLLAALLLAPSGCGASTPEAAFADVKALELELDRYSGAKAELVWLHRHVHAVVDAASDPSRATSSLTFRVVAASFGDQRALSVPLTGPSGAELAVVNARVIAPSGVTPLSPQITTGEPERRVDPGQKTWRLGLSNLPEGWTLVEVVARLELTGTLVSDARPLSAAGGPTAELLIRYDVPSHAESSLQVLHREPPARPIVTKKEGSTLLAVRITDLPPLPRLRSEGAEAEANPLPLPRVKRTDVVEADPRELPYLRYVTRRASPRNYKQVHAISWSQVARPLKAELLERSKGYRENAVHPRTPRTKGEEALQELYLWVRDRIQPDDALDADWDEGRNLLGPLEKNELHATDKVNLLHWLLEGARIPHQLAVARAPGLPKIDPGFPFPGGFSKPLIYLPETGRWVDPACAECALGEVREGLRGQQALVLSEQVGPPMEIEIPAAK